MGKNIYNLKLIFIYYWVATLAGLAGKILLFYSTGWNGWKIDLLSEREYDFFNECYQYH